MTNVALSLLAAAADAWVLWPILVGPEPAPAGNSPRNCPRCGPRPESEARYCSNCGSPTTSRGGS